MFDAPLDGLVVWVGLATISLTVAGIALSLPTAAAPDASLLAQSIDEVATSPHEVTTTVRPDADAFRLRPSQVSLRDRGGTAHAPLVAAEPVPVTGGSLRRVLSGQSPAVVFGNVTAYERALATARDRRGTWLPARDRLHLRRVSWRGVDATLVG